MEVSNAVASLRKAWSRGIAKPVETLSLKVAPEPSTAIRHSPG
eukprot:IDg19192t1